VQTAMAKPKIKFVCRECGYETAKWLGRCPGCGVWGSMEEVPVWDERVRASSRAPLSSGEVAPPLPITRIESAAERRMPTGIAELDRVLGGGIVPGSLVLVGGDPGIGKSTLLMQMCHRIAEYGSNVLYVSGEESARQTKLRADRLGALSERLFVLCETDLERIEAAVGSLRPDVLVVDSVQTVYHPAVPSAPGSVAQVRECTGYLMRLAKQQGPATVLVGHVTKEGAIAGPRLLEHMVDCVLYFEGERHHAYRVLRSVKNRFGSTHEIGVFEMGDAGLKEVPNPSERFLDERPAKASGSIVVASMEGSRPILVELQALVAPTTFPAPRRTATGIDHNRLSLIIAVLEKRVGLVLQNQDVYVNVAGGVRVDEPAVDLGIAVSAVSSFRDRPTSPNDVVFGEIGLTGEVRSVSRVDQRVREAAKLGFRRVILPRRSLKGWTPPPGIEVVGVDDVVEALAVAIG